MPMELGDCATWFTGVATLMLFMVTLRQLQEEIKKRQKEEQERLYADRRLQAEQVAAWIETEFFDDEHGPMVCVAVNNQSFQPIYNVVVQGILLSDTGDPIAGPFPENRSQIAVVPPGKGYTTFPFDYHGMFKRPGIEIAFQDAANRYWLRKTNGELVELAVSPVVFYNISLPTGWSMLLETCPELNDAKT